MTVQRFPMIMTATNLRKNSKKQARVRMRTTVKTSAERRPHLPPRKVLMPDFYKMLSVFFSRTLAAADADERRINSELCTFLSK
jgi:hypothetical protein